MSETCPTTVSPLSGIGPGETVLLEPWLNLEGEAVEEQIGCTVCIVMFMKCTLYKHLIVQPNLFLLFNTTEHSRITQNLHCRHWLSVIHYQLSVFSLQPGSIWCQPGLSFEWSSPSSPEKLWHLACPPTLPWG